MATIAAALLLASLAALALYLRARPNGRRRDRLPPPASERPVAGLRWPAAASILDVPSIEAFIGRASAHEAGHTFVAWLSPYVVDVVGVGIAIDGGCTIYSMRRRGTDGQRWDEIAITLGGIAGEAVALGKILSYGARDDLMQALSKAIELHAANPRALAACPWEDDPSSSVLDVGAMYAVPVDPPVREILNVAYRRARGLLKTHKGSHDRIRQAIADRGALQAADLAAMLGPRPWVLP